MWTKTNGSAIKSLVFMERKPAIHAMNPYGMLWKVSARLHAASAPRVSHSALYLPILVLKKLASVDNRDIGHSQINIVRSLLSNGLLVLYIHVEKSLQRQKHEAMP